MSATFASVTVLGMMTGTSCDGLDASCIRLDVRGWEPLWSASIPYPPHLRKAVLALQKPGSRHALREVLKLHAELGDWYGEAVVRLLKDKRRAVPDIIANHGQTVGHFPEDHPGTTLQLGDPTRIAAACGLSVAAGFRYGDIAAGGQGAPLVPLFHRSLAGALDPEQRGIAIHNLGGISNLTYIPPGDRPTIAFDTGPGNSWIDAAAARATRGKQSFDRGGKLARAGRVDAAAMRRLLAHPFYKHSPPKSTGRDDFPVEDFFAACKKKGPDLVATATALTVESIGRAYEKFILAKRLPLARVYVCGGGAKNPALLDGLRKRLPKLQFQALDQFGLDPQMIESQAFAYFGFLSLLGKPLGGPWTGAKGFGSPAQLIPGKNWPRVVSTVSSLMRGGTS